jgi:hypothetical protein
MSAEDGWDAFQNRNFTGLRSFVPHHTDKRTTSCSWRIYPVFGIGPLSDHSVNQPIDDFYRSNLCDLSLLEKFTRD